MGRSYGANAIPRIFHPPVGAGHAREPIHNRRASPLSRPWAAPTEPMPRLGSSTPRRSGPRPRTHSQPPSQPHFAAMGRSYGANAAPRIVPPRRSGPRPRTDPAQSKPGRVPQWIITDTLHKTGTQGVGNDITRHCQQVFIMPNRMVVVARLPEWQGQAGRLIDQPSAL